MKRNIKSVVTALLLISVLVLVACLSGCNQADVVSTNLPQEADSFNIRRKITVFNLRTDTMLFTCTGNFSIKNSSADELAVIGENPDRKYYKHYIRLPGEVTYIVEDIGSTGVNRYAYEVNINPKLLFAVTPAFVD